jgi:hypothetical protein
MIVVFHYFLLLAILGISGILAMTLSYHYRLDYDTARDGRATKQIVFCDKGHANHMSWVAHDQESHVAYHMTYQALPNYLSGLTHDHLL